MPATDYLMVLPVQHYRISDRTVAVESAFAEHLRMMRVRIGEAGTRLVVASPAMAAADYQSRKAGLAIMDEQRESIAFHTLFSPDDVRSTGSKIRRFLPLMKAVHSLVQQSYCVHSGLSWDAWLPFEFASIVFAILLRRRTVFVVDIDYRNSARMSYRIGDWSWKSYFICHHLYDRARSLQVSIAARFCTVVLLKGKKMASDFGCGRANVKAFLDASHSERNLIDDQSLAAKLDEILDKSQPVRLIYFGRLTAYKGIDRCIRSVAAAHRAGANVDLEIVGDGDQRENLQKVAAECGCEDYVHFRGSLPFNQDFFRLLYRFHMLLAAPLREDTPRSALDAMAAGVPYLAFNTYYYEELLESEAGRTVPWPEVADMAAAIVELAANRERIAAMAAHAVAFARLNTQEIWLERRFDWIMPTDQTSDLVAMDR